MNIKNIINNYEIELQKKEEEQKKEFEEKKQQRVFNGRAIERCIRSIIEPVFEKAKLELHQLDHPCNVDLILRKDEQTGIEQTIAIGIKLTTKITKGSKLSLQDSYLTYEGNFNCQELTKKYFIAEMRKPPDESSPMSLHKITTDLVEDDIEKFLEQVFVVTR